MINRTWSYRTGENESAEEYDDYGGEEENDSFFFARLPSVQITTIVLYGVVLLLSLSSNLLVIVAIAMNRRLRTGTNILVLNLAVADIVYCASGMIFTPLGLLSDGWFGGAFTCKLIPVLASVSVHVISLTTLSIAVDRSIRTVAKQNSALQLRAAAVVALVVWSVAAAFSVPVGTHMEMSTENGRCGESWTQDEVTYRRAYSLLCLVLQFVVPAAVISVCYYRMMRFFKQRRCEWQARSYSSERRRMLVDLKRSRNVSKLSLAIIISFIILFIPLNVFNLVAEYDIEAIDKSQYALLMFIASHLITSLSTVANPIFYGCFNTTFQRCLKRSHVFSKLFRVGPSPHF